jgi:hypothetical protein
MAYRHAAPALGSAIRPLPCSSLPKMGYVVRVASATAEAAAVRRPANTARHIKTREACGRKAEVSSCIVLGLGSDDPRQSWSSQRFNEIDTPLGVGEVNPTVHRKAKRKVNIAR